MFEQLYFVGQREGQLNIMYSLDKCVSYSITYLAIFMAHNSSRDSGPEFYLIDCTIGFIIIIY